MFDINYLIESGTLLSSTVPLDNLPVVSHCLDRLRTINRRVSNAIYQQPAIFTKNFSKTSCLGIEQVVHVVYKMSTNNKTAACSKCNNEFSVRERKDCDPMQFGRTIISALKFSAAVIGLCGAAYGLALLAKTPFWTCAGIVAIAVAGAFSLAIFNHRRSGP